MQNILDLLDKIKGADVSACSLAREHQKNLIKPLGSLGLLEEISIKIAGITGKVKNSCRKKIVFLFGADNGVYEEGVSGSPKELTKSLMEDYADGKNCAINVICKSCNTDLKIINMGVDNLKGHIGMDDRIFMGGGTYNFAKRAAMDDETVVKALNTGAEYALWAKNSGYGIIGNGEVGMGNTTTSAICIMAACGVNDVEKCVGRGAGLSDISFIKKKKVISESLLKYNLSANDPFNILKCVGGLDIAAMTGLYLGAAFYRIPIVIDGLISAAAALLAFRFCDKSADFMIASHASAEPAYKIAINALSLTPMLNLGMRLGEGSGCPLAFRIIETACDINSNMATFEDVNINQDYRKDMKMK